MIETNYQETSACSQLHLDFREVSRCDEYGTVTIWYAFLIHGSASVMNAVINCTLEINDDYANRAPCGVATIIVLSEEGKHLSMVMSTHSIAIPII